jgi:chemotaxis protein histidine kinase CheA
MSSEGMSTKPAAEVEDKPTAAAEQPRRKRPASERTPDPDEIVVAFFDLTGSGQVYEGLEPPDATGQCHQIGTNPNLQTTRVRSVNVLRDVMPKMAPIRAPMAFKKTYPSQQPSVSQDEFPEEVKQMILMQTKALQEEERKRTEKKETEEMLDALDAEEDEAKRQAKAEAEAKHQAEEQAKAEAEAKRQAEEQAKAEAEAKRQAEEQAKAEAEAKRQAEEQAKAEEEAKRQAEATAAAELSRGPDPPPPPPEDDTVSVPVTTTTEYSGPATSVLESTAAIAKHGMILGGDALEALERSGLILEPGHWDVMSCLNLDEVIIEDPKPGKEPSVAVDTGAAGTPHDESCPATLVFSLKPTDEPLPTEEKSADEPLPTEEKSADEPLPTEEKPTKGKATTPAPRPPKAGNGEGKPGRGAPKGKKAAEGRRTSGRKPKANTRYVA